jgi:hypothetical protein
MIEYRICTECMLASDCPAHPYAMQTIVCSDTGKLLELRPDAATDERWPLRVVDEHTDRE